MGLSASKRERLKQIAAEVQEILGGCLHADGRPMTFSELEDECIEAGDLLTAGVIERRVAQRETAQDECCCPSCQRPGVRLPDDVMPPSCRTSARRRHGGEQGGGLWMMLIEIGERGGTSLGRLHPDAGRYLG